MCLETNLDRARRFFRKRKCVIAVWNYWKLFLNFCCYFHWLINKIWLLVFDVMLDGCCGACLTNVSTREFWGIMASCQMHVADMEGENLWTSEMVFVSLLKKLSNLLILSSVHQLVQIKKNVLSCYIYHCLMYGSIYEC